MAFPDLQIQPASGLTFPWVEFIGRKLSSGESTFGMDGGNSITMQILIQWSDLNDALQELLGACFTRIKKFNRVLPWRHPYFPDMYCTRIISMRGLRFRRKSIFFGGGPVSEYDYLHLTLQFTRPKYAVLSDNQIGDNEEYKRFVDWNWTPSIQMLSREGTKFRYQEGQLTAPRGILVPGSVGSKIVKVKLSRTWHMLPPDAILASNGLPTKLLFASVATPLGGLEDVPTLGSVNSAEWFGCEPETLMLIGIEIKPRPFPIPFTIMTNSVGNRPYRSEQSLLAADITNFYPFMLDVTHHYEYFHPTRGYKDHAARTFVDTVGHNCMPWAGDGRWYLVGHMGGANGVPAEGEKPFTPIPFSNLYSYIGQ